MSTTTAHAAGSSGRPWRGRIFSAVGAQNLSLLIALAILVAIFGWLRSDVFFTARNLVNIGLAITILGILAMAQTVVIVSGGLDISVGSVVGLTTMVIAIAIQVTGSVSLGLAAGVAAGLLAGLVNGLIIVYGPVNAVIATLGTMSAFRGLAYITNNGNSVPILDDLLRLLGTGTVAGIPLAIWLLLIVMAVFALFMRSTVIGRNIYAIGGNQTVARLAGIPIRRYQIAIYAMSGAAAALAGIVLAGRTMSGQPASGSQGLELEAITAAILGGCALQGGKGTIVGAMLGVLIIGVLNNGMILTSVPTFYQLLAKGALLVLAVIIQERQRVASGNKPVDDASDHARPQQGVSIAAGPAAEGGKVHDATVRTLGAWILGGRYRPGDLLPREDDLTIELGVSRTTLREAVKVLGAKGLLEARPRIGVKVRARDDWHVLDPVVLSWHPDIRRDPDLVSGLVEARRIIEPAAAELAARRATGADLAVIENAYLGMQAALPSDLRACCEADLAFHAGVIAASHNVVLRALVGTIEAALRSSFLITGELMRAQSEAIEAHGVVFECIRMRDAPGAREAMNRLLDIAAEDLHTA